MLSLLRNISNAQPVTTTPIRPGDPVPPGLLVTVPGERAVGTVSAFVDGPHGPRAKVVVTDPERRTWITLVSLHRLSL